MGILDTYGEALFLAEIDYVPAIFLKTVSSLDGIQSLLIRLVSFEKCFLIKCAQFKKYLLDFAFALNVFFLHILLPQKPKVIIQYRTVSCDEPWYNSTVGRNGCGKN